MILKYVLGYIIKGECTVDMRADKKRDGIMDNNLEKWRKHVYTCSSQIRSPAGLGIVLLLQGHLFSYRILNKRHFQITHKRQGEKTQDRHFSKN